MLKTNKPIRGFDALIGESIVAIDASSINVVKFHLLGGKTVEVWAEERHYGIEVIEAKAYTE